MPLADIVDTSKLVREFEVFNLPYEIVLQGKYRPDACHYLVIWKHCESVSTRTEEHKEDEKKRFWKQFTSLGVEVESAFESLDKSPNESPPWTEYFEQPSSPAAGQSTTSRKVDLESSYSSDKAGKRGNLVYGEAWSSNAVADGPVQRWLRTHSSRSVHCYGLMGIVHLLQGPYVVLITGREQVATIGKGPVYLATSTQILSCCVEETMHPLDAKYIALLTGCLTSIGGFHFSYDWNLTRSIQQQCDLSSEPSTNRRHLGYDTRFVFNNYLLSSMAPSKPESQPLPFRWMLPMIQGAVLQDKFEVSGRYFFLTLIARRSRYRVGPRYFRRGIDRHGRVANELECEQIVWDAAPLFKGTSRADAAARASKGSGIVGIASLVLLRGSIPLFWGHEETTTLRPRIIVYEHWDPDFAALKAHFADLLARYNAPIAILNMVKQSPSNHPEHKLSEVFVQGLAKAKEYFKQNVTVTSEKQPLKYCEFDWANTEAKEGFDATFRKLCSTARELLNHTGFFTQSWIVTSEKMALCRDMPSCQQNGLIRVNCIDCLDRTNLGMFAVAQEALRRQLILLGCSPSRHPAVMSSATAITDWAASPLPLTVVARLGALWGALGDAAAVAYAGSPAMHRAAVIPLKQRASTWCCGEQPAALEEFEVVLTNGSGTNVQLPPHGRNPPSMLRQKSPAAVPAKPAELEQAASPLVPSVASLSNEQQSSEQSPRLLRQPTLLSSFTRLLTHNTPDAPTDYSKDLTWTSLAGAPVLSGETTSQITKMLSEPQYFSSLHRALRESSDPVPVRPACEFALSKRSNVGIVVQRYLHNVFSDLDRQRGIYLLLGRFVPEVKKPSIWETDVFLLGPSQMPGKLVPGGKEHAFRLRKNSAALSPKEVMAAARRESLFCKARNGDAACGWVVDLCAGEAQKDATADIEEEFLVPPLEGDQEQTLGSSLHAQWSSTLP